MDWLRTLLSRCMAVFVEKKLDEELNEELGSHIEFAIQDNLRRGMSEEDARRMALKQFGGLTQVKESYRLRRGLPFFDSLGQDVRFAARQIMRAPGFAAVAILTLALGIGANTAVFTLTHALLLRTLPVRDPGELVRLLLVPIISTITFGWSPSSSPLSMRQMTFSVRSPLMPKSAV